MVFRLSLNQKSCALHKLPYRSLFHPLGEEPGAGGPAQRLPGRVRGDGGGDGKVLWFDDRKGTGAPGPGWGGSSQAVGGQQQAGGSGEGGRVRQVKPTGRRPEQSCTEWYRADTWTEPRTSCQCGGAVGGPLGQQRIMDLYGVSCARLIGTINGLDLWFWLSVCTCLHVPASGYFL